MDSVKMDKDVGPSAANQLPDQVKGRIEDLLKANRVVLFMKGTPAFPMCGFSARAVAILRELAVEFGSANVLEDEELRQGIKVFGNWPTIPQLYVDGQLIGGSDIMWEMFESGELAEVLGAPTAEKS